MEILQSNADYGEVFPRVVEMLMIGLGIAVAGMIFANAYVLYPGTPAIRFAGTNPARFQHGK